MSSCCTCVWKGEKNFVQGCLVSIIATIIQWGHVFLYASSSGHHVWLVLNHVQARISILPFVYDLVRLNSVVISSDLVGTSCAFCTAISIFANAEGWFMVLSFQHPNHKGRSRHQCRSEVWVPCQVYRMMCSTYEYTMDSELVHSND